MKSGCEVCEIVIDPPFFASSPPQAAMTDMERAARRRTSARLPSVPIQNPSRFVSAGWSARRREDTPRRPIPDRLQSDKNLPLTQQIPNNGGVRSGVQLAEQFLSHHRE